MTDGLLITPGPDLIYFTGLRPPVTERLTMLVMPAKVLVVPALEHPGELPGFEVVPWRDGENPYSLVVSRL
jgi:Xaa-Pro aminopeptidase